MVTLKQLFQVFGHDPNWGKLAAQSAQPMVSVFMRKLGDTDITLLTDFDIEMQLALSEQPEDRKTKARSCMHYLLRWAKEQGKDVPQIAHPNEVNAQDAEEPTKQNKVVSKPKTDCKPKAKERKKHDGRSYRKPEKKVAYYHPEHLDALQDYSDKHNVNMYDSESIHGRPSTGTIYHDNASKGYSKTGKRVYNDCWRAEIVIAGQRFRHRSKERQDCVAWLKAVKQGKIKPTENKADWWRMEQRKDEDARIDELIVSAAEEANIVYEYRQTGDTEILYNYCIKALLPHMVYYCAHSLHLGRDRSLTCSRQAVGLILTKIVGGRPVTNITFTCKRMLRTYKNRGDFWYYDKAPEDVKLMVNRIDMSALADLYKVTKDRKI
jgi:outer membrane biosynthesis protein TonB